MYSNEYENSHERYLHRPAFKMEIKFPPDLHVNHGSWVSMKHHRLNASFV